jgi:hypothetical protein
MDIESMMLRAPFTRGGKPKAQFRARTEGPVQIAGTPTDGNDFRWLLKPDSIKDNPVKGKFTYDTNAESVTSNATMYDLTLNWNTAMQGGRVRVSTRMRLDD